MTTTVRVIMLDTSGELEIHLGHHPSTLHSPHCRRAFDADDNAIYSAARDIHRSCSVRSAVKSVASWQNQLISNLIRRFYNAIRGLSIIFHTAIYRDAVLKESHNGYIE